VQNVRHPFTDSETVLPKTEIITLYADGSLNLSESVRAYTELLLNRRESFQNNQTQFFQIGYTHDALNYGFGGPTEDGAIGDPFSRITGAGLVSPTPLLDSNDSSQRVDYGRLLVGLGGRVNSAGYFNDWTWDLYAQHSHNKGQHSRDVVLLDSMNTRDFRTGSCAGTVTEVAQRQCIDVRWDAPRAGGRLLPARDRVPGGC
jgi:iron complex outermembrane recepter protein